jgi:hypothetical protein
MRDPPVPGGSWGLSQWNQARLDRLKAKYREGWLTDAAQFAYFTDEVEGKIAGGTAVPTWPQQRDLSNAAAISRAMKATVTIRPKHASLMLRNGYMRIAKGPPGPLRPLIVLPPLGANLQSAPRCRATHRRL